MLKKIDRYTGLGSSSYGEETAITAAKKELLELRKKRLHDTGLVETASNGSTSVRGSHVVTEFETIVAAINAADNQFLLDNANFVTEHNLTIESILSA